MGLFSSMADQVDLQMDFFGTKKNTGFSPEGARRGNKGQVDRLLGKHWSFEDPLDLSFKNLSVPILAFSFTKSGHDDRYAEFQVSISTLGRSEHWQLAMDCFRSPAQAYSVSHASATEDF